MKQKWYTEKGKGKGLYTVRFREFLYQQQKNFNFYEKQMVQRFE
jgi:hypothetical protein